MIIYYIILLLVYKYDILYCIIYIFISIVDFEPLLFIEKFGIPIKKCVYVLIRRVYVWKYGIKRETNRILFAVPALSSLSNMEIQQQMKFEFSWCELQNKKGREFQFFFCHSLSYNLHTNPGIVVQFSKNFGSNSILLPSTFGKSVLGLCL